MKAIFVEKPDGTVSVRSRTGGDLGPHTVAGFMSAALEEIARKGREAQPS